MCSPIGCICLCQDALFVDCIRQVCWGIHVVVAGQIKEDNNSGRPLSMIFPDAKEETHIFLKPDIAAV